MIFVDPFATRPLPLTIEACASVGPISSVPHEYSSIGDADLCDSCEWAMAAGRHRCSYARSLSVPNAVAAAPDLSVFVVPADCPMSSPIVSRERVLHEKEDSVDWGAMRVEIL